MTSNTKRITLYTLSFISFLIAIAFLCACSDSISVKLLDIIKIFKPNLSVAKLAKLKGVLYGNVFLFTVFGILFILLNFLKFPDIKNKAIVTFSIFHKFGRLKLTPYAAALILLFCVISVIRFYWLNQKQTFHIDEIYGISIVTQNEYGLWSGKSFEKGKAYTGKEIKDLIFFDDASIKDTARDLVHLWIYNKDTAYNNLFIYLSRLWFTGFKSSDFKSTFLRAGILNFIFFCFAFYFFYLLVSECTDRKLTKLLLLSLAFLNPASVGLFVFMRSYALQECVLILFSYLFVFYYKNIQAGAIITTKKNFIRTAIVCAILFSTDYFSVLYLGILGLILIYLSIRKKDYNLLIFLFCAVFAGLLLTKCFYLNYGTGFFSGRGAEAFSEITSSAFSNISFTILELNNFISKNFVALSSMIIFSVAGFWFNYKNNSKNITTTIIFCSSLAFCFILLYISPLKTLRYIAPVFPLLSFALLVNTNNHKFNFAIFALQLCLVILAVKNVLPVKSNFSKIEHLNDADPTVMDAKFLKDLENPIIIGHDCVYPSVLPYLQDNQTVYFADTLEEAKQTYNRTFWYLTHIENETDSRLFSEELIEKE